MSVALFDLSTADRSYGGDAPAVFLDCGDSGAPAAAEFRADLLLCVFGVGLLFWRIPAGAECSVVLLNDSPAACDILLGRGVPGLVVSSLLTCASANRVRANT